MRNLTIAAVNEFYKIFSGRRNFVFLIIAALIPIGAGISLCFLNPVIGIVDAYTGKFPLFMLGMLLQLVLPVISCIITLGIFSDEFANGNIKVALLNPISRVKLYTAKIIASALYMTIFLLSVFISSTTVTLILGIGSNSFLSSLTAYVVSILPLLAVIIITAFISQFFKSGGSALAVIILLSAGLKLLGMVYPTVDLLLPTTWLDWYKYWDFGHIAAGSILLSFTTILGCIIIFFASGFHLFDSKEF